MQEIQRYIDVDVFGDCGKKVLDFLQQKLAKFLLIVFYRYVPGNKRKSVEKWQQTNTSSIFLSKTLCAKTT